MPYLGRVVGNLWAMRMAPDMGGVSLRWVQPLTGELNPNGRPIVAADAMGAGPGELIFYVTAYEAVLGYGVPMVPLDATIVGIVDRCEPANDQRA